MNIANMMKRKILFILTAVGTLTISAQTQQQKGIVKTPGRMVNGKLVSGKAIPQAQVILGDSSKLLTDTKTGSFSFFVHNQKYSIKDVKKDGYQLVDPQVCRQYNYSTNLLYLVMETVGKQQDVELEAQKKIRRTLQRQLQQREDELEKLKVQHKLTQEEYQKARQQLYDDQEKNEKLIKEMAKRFSQLDYDQMDEFYQQVSNYIENGDLVKADSLLRSRGDVNSQIKDQFRNEQIIQQKKEELAKAEAVIQHSKEELAKRCFS